jgi:WD40 repeat protein
VKSSIHMELHASKGLTLSRKTCHPFLILPLELCVHIISYLSQKDIGRMCQVSREWKKLFDNNSCMWDVVYKQFFNTQIPSFDGNDQIKTKKTIFVERYSLEQNWVNGNYKEMKITLLPQQTRIYSMRISPDRRWLVTGDDCFVRLFRFSRETKKTTLKEEGVIGKHRWMVWNVQYSNDMQYIYSSGHDGSVRMWRLERVAHKVDKDTIPNYQLDDPGTPRFFY